MKKVIDLNVKFVEENLLNSSEAKLLEIMVEARAMKKESIKQISSKSKLSLQRTLTGGGKENLTLGDVCKPGSGLVFKIEKKRTLKSKLNSKKTNNLIKDEGKF